MSDEVLEFMREQFRKVRSDIAQLGERMDRIERRLGRVEEHMGSLVRDHYEREREFSALDARLRRVEDRLELRDA